MKARAYIKSIIPEINCGDEFLELTLKVIIPKSNFNLIKTKHFETEIDFKTKEE